MVAALAVFAAKPWTGRILMILYPIVLTILHPPARVPKDIAVYARIMTQNGPKGKSVDDVQLAKALFLSTDMVAADTASVKFFTQFREMNIDQVSHIKLAQDAAVGTMNLDALKIERIKI